MQDPITRRPLRGGVQSGHAGTYRREGMQMRGAPLQGALRRASRFARPRPHIALAPAARCAALLVADALRRERAPGHVDARASTGSLRPVCARVPAAPRHRPIPSRAHLADSHQSRATTVSPAAALRAMMSSLARTCRPLARCTPRRGVCCVTPRCQCGL